MHLEDILGLDATNSCEWKFLHETGSDRAKAYQEQITGLPFGMNCVKDGVRFDSYDYQRGVYIDAKSGGYASEKFYNPDLSPKLDWYTGHDKTIGQLVDQVTAAQGKLVEWYVATVFLRRLSERSLRKAHS